MTKGSKFAETEIEADAVNSDTAGKSKKSGTVIFTSWNK
jgi:hypothetical protein